MFRHRLVHVVTLAVLVAPCLVVIAQVAGAPGHAMIRVTPLRGGAFDPDPPAITPAHVKTYARVLALTEAQRASADDMLHAYLNEHSTAAALMQQKIDDARAASDESKDIDAFVKVMMGAQREFHKAMNAARDRFFDDLRLVLIPDQEQQWPALERTRRRLETIERGSLSGETVDLVALVDDMEYPGEVQAGLDPVLRSYETSLDAALVQRNQAQSVLSEKMNQGPRAPDFFSENAGELAAIHDASVKICGINQSFARQLSDSLPGERKDAFDTEFEHRSVPQAYTSTYTAHTLDAALGFQDLTPDQKRQIGELQERFDGEMKAASDHLARAIREDEASPDVQILIAEQMGMPAEFRIGNESEDLRKAREARMDLGANYLQQVRALLSPDQRARLPRRDPPDRAVGTPGLRTMIIDPTDGSAPPPPAPPQHPGGHG